MTPINWRKRLAKATAKNQGVTVLDRRGRPWVCSTFWVVRSELVDGEFPAPPGDKAPRWGRALRRLMDAESWPANRRGVTVRDKFKSIPLRPFEIGSAPAHFMCVYGADEQVALIEQAATQAGFTRVAWETTGRELMLRRSRDRMLLAALATFVITDPWDLEVIE